MPWDFSQFEFKEIQANIYERKDQEQHFNFVACNCALCV